MTKTDKENAIIWINRIRDLKEIVELSYPTCSFDLLKFVKEKKVEFNVGGNKIKLTLTEYINSDLFKL